MMAWLIRESKRYVGLMVRIVVLVIAGWFLAPHADREWRHRREDMARKEKDRAENKKWWERRREDMARKEEDRGLNKQGWENGYKAGYLTGYAAAAGGVVEPSDAEVAALAMGQATKENVPEGERMWWKMGFAAGWTFGWSKGK